MGGRGKKGAKGMATPGKKNGKKSEPANLPTDRLTYGENDPHVAGDTRSKVEDFENKRRNAKIEYNMSVDNKGIIRDMNKGGPHSCSVSLYWLDSAVSHTHIHPLGKVAKGFDVRYEMGGTFSVKDLDNLVKTRCSNYRAAAAEGTYSISKLPSTNGKGLVMAYQQAYDNIIADFADRISKLNTRYLQSTSMPYDDYLKEYSSEWSTALIQLHNWLLSNQSKYNYYYTLERV